MSDTVRLTIDGQEISVPRGTLVIRAAEQLGIVIPRFCDHPLLDPLGACRQCMVEVEGQRKPLTACTTECTDGMVVRTHLTSEVARQAQQAVLEFLLINHPLDCPMCDKGGECPLQDQALEHGSGVSRFVDQKRRYPKPVAVSPQILLDRERCVLCARCTRFAAEISGDPFIELFERGALEQVAIYEDEPYRSEFSGNIIQICPVGALTSSSYRFRARPFDLRSASSVCDHCSAGCNLIVQSRSGQVLRQLARTNMDVNEMWNCDRGRFGYAYLRSSARLTEPAVRKDGELVAVSWAEALAVVADATDTALRGGPGRVAVLCGGHLADEDAYVISRFTRTVLGSDDLDHRTWLPAPDEDAALAAVLDRSPVTYADIDRATTIVVVGLDPRQEVPILYLRLRRAWRKRQARLVPVGPWAGSLGRYAWQRLGTPPGGELGALAAVGRQLGVAALAEVAVATGYHDSAVEDVAAALRDAGPDALLLVGERGAATPGVLAACGRIADHLGAKVAWVPRRAGARGALEAGLAAGWLPGARRLDDPADRAAVEAVWGPLPPPGRDVRGVLTAAAEGDIDVLYLIGVDLLRDCTDPALARRAVERVPTVIAQDLLHTETVAAADVVLPAVAAQERSGTLTDWEGRRQPFHPAVEPPALARPDWEIVAELAALLGRDLGYFDLASIRAERDRLGMRSGPPRPWPDPPAPAPPSPPGEGLQLLTYPVLIDRASMLTDADDLHRSAPPATVVCHPEDARARGLEDGSLVEVRGPGGSLRLPLRTDPDVVRGCVYVPANSSDLPARQVAGPGGRVELAEVPR